MDTLLPYAKGISPAISALKNGLPFHVKDKNCVFAEREADLDWLSESDIEALSGSLAAYGKMSFHGLTNVSHKYPAYKNATGHWMNFQDFLDDNDDKDDRIEELEFSSRRMVI